MNNEELKDYIKGVHESMKNSLETHIKDDKEAFKEIKENTKEIVTEIKEQNKMLYKIVGGLVLTGILAQIYFGHH